MGGDRVVVWPGVAGSRSMVVGIRVVVSNYRGSVMVGYRSRSMGSMGHWRAVCSSRRMVNGSMGILVGSPVRNVPCLRLRVERQMCHIIIVVSKALVDLFLGWELGPEVLGVPPVAWLRLN